MNFHFITTSSKNDSSIIKFDIVDKKDNKEIPYTNLLEQQYDNPIYFLPKNFTINTQKGSYKFNIDMIKDLSSVIKKYNLSNPNNFQYNMNIIDELNVMLKFEQLCNGSQVAFSAIEIFILQKIINALNLKCFPETLNNFSFDNNKSQQYNIIIDKQSLLEFLQKMPKHYTIKTKKEEYKCNVAGINSSKIISNYLEKSPQLHVFEYDFNDKNNEFQIICDYFNYHSIIITAKNMQNIKKIAKDLQIECIFDDIENFNSNFISSLQTIKQFKFYIDSVENLTNCLYNINDSNIETIKNYILKSIWSDDETYVQELSSYIYQVIHKDIQLHPFLINLIILLDQAKSEKVEIKKLKPFLIKTLLNHLGNNKYNCSFVYKLYQNGMISQKEITDMIISKSKGCFDTNDNKDKGFSFNFKISTSKPSLKPSNGSSLSFTNQPSITSIDKKNQFILNNIFVWFFPELIEANIFSIDNIFSVIDNIHKSFINLYYPSKIDAFKKMRESGKPDDIIAKTLRDDDVDNLQIILSNKAINDMKVPFNIYESIIENGNTSLINYCAFYNSIKCFKYLLSLNVPLNKTFWYALYNDNSSIIDILKDSITFSLADLDIISAKNATDITKIPHPFISSMIKHKYNLVDSLVESYPLLMINYNIIWTSIFMNGNIHSFTKFIEEGLSFFSFSIVKIAKMISLSAISGFYILTKLIFALIINNENSLLYFNELNINVNIGDFVSNGNLAILKLYEVFNCKKFDNAIKLSVKNGYLDIIQYFFESQKLNLPLMDVSNIIKECIYNNKINIFLYLIKQQKFFEFVNKDSNDSQLLCWACETGNVKMVEIINDLFKNKNPKLDCTDSLIIAVENNFSNISTYLLKYGFFSNSQICLQVSKLSTLSKQSFSLLYEKICTNIEQNEIEILKSLKTYLKETINKKNYDVVEFLLEHNIQYDESLFDAVKIDDIKMVNLILKYENSPSFINQISEKGTALLIAVKSNNYGIAKLLLSVKGINPSLYANDNITPLVSAFINFNIDIINLIIQFYDKSIESQVWQFNEAIKHILKNPQHSFNCFSFSNFNLQKHQYSNLLKIFSTSSNNFTFSKSTTNEFDFNNLSESNTVKKVINFYKSFRLDFSSIISKPNDPLKKSSSYKNETSNSSSNFVSETNPIEYSSQNKNKKKSDAIKILLDIPNVDINCQLCDYTLLTYALDNNLIDIAKILIGSNNCDINLYSSYDGNTPLIIAIKNKNFEIINLLLKSPNININHSNYRKETALTEAVLNELSDIIDIIIQNHKFDAKESRLNFAFGICNCSIAKKLFLVKELNVNEPFEYVIEENSSSKTIQYKTALIYATEKNDFEKVKIIIQHPTFDSNKSFITEAIFKAASLNHFEIFKILFQLINYNINIQLSNIETLFDVSILNSSQEVIYEIITNPNFDPSNYYLNEVFIYMLASAKINDYILDTILKIDKNHEIDFQKLLHSGRSYFTSINGMNINAIKYLLAHGANPNLPDKYGLYPLEHAINTCSFECINALIDTQRIEFNQVSNRKNKTTYLHLAAEKQDSDILKKLFELDLIDINSIDFEGNTPLMIAVKNNRIKNVELLFKRSELNYLYSYKGNDALSIICNKYKEKLNPNQIPKTKQEYLDVLLKYINKTPEKLGNSTTINTPSKKGLGNSTTTNTPWKSKWENSTAINTSWKSGWGNSTIPNRWASGWS